VHILGVKAYLLYNRFLGLLADIITYKKIIFIYLNILVLFCFLIHVFSYLQNNNISFDLFLLILTILKCIQIKRNKILLKWIDFLSYYIMIQYLCIIIKRKMVFRISIVKNGRLNSELSLSLQSTARIGIGANSVWSLREL
jgi:hypothetical protein